MIMDWKMSQWIQRPVFKQPRLKCGEPFTRQRCVTKEFSTNSRLCNRCSEQTRVVLNQGPCTRHPGSTQGTPKGTRLELHTSTHDRPAGRRRVLFCKKTPQTYRLNSMLFDLHMAMCSVSYPPAGVCLKKPTT